MGKEVEEEGSYSRFMNFVKEFGLDNSISHGIDTSAPYEKTQGNESMQNELQNEEDEDDNESSSFNQTRYFQNKMKPALEVQQVVKKFEKLNPLKNKQQTVVKR